MNWITFEAAGGGRVVVQLRRNAAICDEQAEVKPATTSGGVHVLKDISLRRAAALVAQAEDSSSMRPGL
jgi:hypothetical protein